MHVTIDPSVPLTNPGATDDDEEGQADPYTVITNAREASPADGLLSTSELADLFAVAQRPRSLYDEGQRILDDVSGHVPRYGERAGMPPHRRGAYEPEWTSYTHYWQSVLGTYSAQPGLKSQLGSVTLPDYIWVIDPPDQRASVVSLLQPHTTENLRPGLPRKGISGSDHVSLAAEVQWDGIN